MRRTMVESSVIRAVGYDRRRRALEVEFHGGRVYRYRDVAESVFARFLAAASKGRFFNRHILGEYEFDRLD